MEIIKNVSIGMDIATSISVIGAAVTFVLGQKKKFKKNLLLHKIEELKEAIQMLEKEEEKWFLLDEKIKWVLAYGEGNIKSQEIVDTAYYTEFKCKQFVNGSGSVWLNESEIAILKNLIKYLKDFNTEFAKSLSGEEAQLIPIENVKEKISSTIVQLTKCAENNIKEI